MGYQSAAWHLNNWWPHDSLHIHIGHAYWPLIAIELGFHVTLMIGRFILARFVLALARSSRVAL